VREARRRRDLIAAGPTFNDSETGNQEMTRNTIVASLLAATVGMTSMTVPAAAGGSLSPSFAPAGTRDARALNAGLRIFSMIQGARSGASISQNGTGNAAGIAQNGRGNLGIVHQDGNGHSATLQQSGSGNAYGLFQFGERTDANVLQNGNGQAGAAFQLGW
jgi:major curlin subunit